MTVTTAKDKAPVTVVTVGPKVIAVAYSMTHGAPAQTFGVLMADNAPWRKNYTDEQEFFGAMRDYADAESDRVADYCATLADKAKGTRIVVIVSKSAAAHDPSAKVYSRIASVDDLIAGLTIMADATKGEVITVA